MILNATTPDHAVAEEANADALGVPQADAPVTITIPVENVAEAKKRLSKLVKKAARYGCDQITFSVGPRRTEIQVVSDEFSGEKLKIKVEVVDFEITGMRPRVGAYTFVAKLDHTDAGNIISGIPYAETQADERFRYAKACCEHCKARRARKNTYIVANATTGEQIQLGGNCIADYVKIASAASAISSLSIIAEAREMMSGLCRGQVPFNQTLAYVITAAVVSIRLDGWMSKTTAMRTEETSTATSVARLWALRNSKEAEQDAAAIRAAWSPEDAELATKVIHWVRNEMKASNDYTHNLAVAFSSDVIQSAKMIGIAVSGVAAYQREQEVLVRRKLEREKLAASQHVGKVGERIEFSARHTFTRFLGENGFGLSTKLHKFITDEGNVISWITSSGHDFGPNERLSFKATIKEHKEYNGIKETSVTRAKFL